MAERDLDVVRQMYDAFNRGDTERAASYLHPDAEMVQDPRLPDTDVYRGKAAFQAGLRLFLEEWDQARFEIVEAVEAEGRTLLHVRLIGRGKRSGAEVSTELFHLWTLRDGKAFRCEVYSDRESAARTAGPAE